MNWKGFKDLFKTEKINETQFVLGIDIGSDSSSLAYFDIHSNMPEIIDISGGYGKPTVPTVMQYIPESKEWIFGEYAVLNKGVGNEITVSRLIEKMGKKEFINIDNTPMPVSDILGLYLKELVGSIKNLNPKAEIAGIVVAVPSYLSPQAEEELLLAFRSAELNTKIISLVSDRECVLQNYYYSNKVVKEKVLILDYGDRELRGGIYDINFNAEEIHLKNIAYSTSEFLGACNIDKTVKQLFKQYYARELYKDIEKINLQTLDQLNTFTYQHKELLFQKNILLKPVKLYFNFAYPPFQKVITKFDVDEIINPYRKNFKEFLLSLGNRNIYDLNQIIDPEQIDTVIATGGGFEMLWSRNMILEVFPGSNIVFYKNSKSVVAKGASIIGAMKLGVIPSKPFAIEDNHRINVDVGVKIGDQKAEQFIPIVERNTFWWQKNYCKRFIINDNIDEKLNISLFKRNAKGIIEHIYNLSLNDFPQCPKSCGRIAIEIKFENYNKISVVIKDLGFGEIHPKTNYVKGFSEIVL